MGQAESNESAAVKRQAEGGAIPMYELLDLAGMKILIEFLLVSYSLRDTIIPTIQHNDNMFFLV